MWQNIWKDIHLSVHSFSLGDEIISFMSCNHYNYFIYVIKIEAMCSLNLFSIIAQILDLPCWDGSCELGKKYGHCGLLDIHCVRHDTRAEATFFIQSSY